jgi:hypothetical protein
MAGKMHHEIMEKDVNQAAGTIVRCMSLPDITYQVERKDTRIWRRSVGFTSELVKKHPGVPITATGRVVKY